MDITRERWNAMGTIEERWQVMETQAKALGMGPNEIEAHRQTYYTACASMLELTTNRLVNRANLDKEVAVSIFTDLLTEIGAFLLDQTTNMEGGKGH